MRKILFRGQEYNGTKWVYGHFSEDSNGAYITDKKKIRVNPETVGQFVECLNAYEYDVLTGEEIDEYGGVTASWDGVIKYNKETSRIMILDCSGEWYEVDDYDFDNILMIPQV